MDPQLIIAQQHQAELRAEASQERLIRGPRTMERRAASRHLTVTRIATLARRVARSASQPAPANDTVTTA
jgi:hypothetical protein